MSDFIAPLEFQEDYGYDFTRTHTVPVYLNSVHADADADAEDTPFTEGEIVYFSVYTVGQCYGGPEEGGWYYYADYHRYSIPIRYSTENIKLMLEKERARIGEYPYGEITSVCGGQDCYVQIEREAGMSALKEIPRYE